MRRLRSTALLLCCSALLVSSSSADSAITESMKLLGADVDVYDHFGTSVAIDGNTAVVGASTKKGVHDNEGAAYVFERQGSAWVQSKKLLSEDIWSHHYYGSSIAISGDRIAVGAPGHPGGAGPGAAYVFERDRGGAGNWGQAVRILAPDASYHSAFGNAVAIDGTTLVVGSAGESSGEGAAYVFKQDMHDPYSWPQVARLEASHPGSYRPYFGSSVAVLGDTVMVGVKGQDNPSNNGAVYVYGRHQNGLDAWGEIKRILSPSGLQFGSSVAISGGTAIVGAPIYAGVAHLFERDRGGMDNWGLAATIRSSDLQSVDRFGGSVDIDGDRVIAGALFEDSGGGHAGAAYVFERDQGGSGEWGEVAKFMASDAVAEAHFGQAVAVSGTIEIIGAPMDSGAGSRAGAAYVFGPANEPPVAMAGVDQTVECGPECVTLDGSLSWDPDDDPLSFEWTDENANIVATGESPSLTLPLGSHTITLTVRDLEEEASSDTVEITVVDETGPTVSQPTASPSQLWPPNHKMTSVNVAVQAWDSCDEAASACQIVEVTSNEPANGTGDGDTSPDWDITGPLTVNLRAERAGKGSGRTYTITLRCADVAGNPSVTAVEVTVPKSKGK